MLFSRSKNFGILSWFTFGQLC